MDNISDFIYTRITRLREDKGISARDLSLSLGLNHSYINRIENRQALPSYECLNDICSYFGITLSQFFDEENKHPVEVQQLTRESMKLNRDILRHLVEIARHLNKY